MSAITKERIELFIKNPLDNGLARGEQMELARIALASLEAEASQAVPDEMTPEMMRAVQLNSELGAYAASNLSGAYYLFSEFWKVACRAAMLQGANDSLTHEGKNHSEDKLGMVNHLGDANEKGNSPVIPDGWKLVPIDPTKDMLRAGQSVVGFWLNTVHCYSKMLAAAPAAPQQEVTK